MSDLSQAEIDALLAGGGDDNSSSDDASSGGDNVEELLSPIEKDALGEIGNISMGNAATTLSTLLGHKVSITTPSVTVAPMNVIQQHYPLPYLVVEVAYTVGIDGNNVFAIQATDAAIIADLMMGGDGTNPDPELNEIHLSAVGEAMNQMMGAVATSLSTMFNKKIDISPPKVNLVDFGKEDLPSADSNEPMVRASFRMEVDGLIDSEIMQILTVKVAKDMVDSLMGGGDEPAPEPAAPPPPPPTPAPPPPPKAAAPPPPQQNYPPPQQNYPPPPPPQQYPPQNGYGNGYGYGGSQMQPNVVTNMPVSPAQFTPLSMEPVQINEANIGLILDVPLQVTVELGRTKKTIKEILDLATGSIVELDKLAGEPVEIQVNGHFLAKGEVVVIDENFGVRITEIASPAERAAHLA
ncbi:MAG: flagellar motor switch phosphatase FliY [Selenomonadaceae bacterium]|nr:flagellar motor switch phosphatase FliY [Selenomonadaceae bacterium]